MATRIDGAARAEAVLLWVARFLAALLLAGCAVRWLRLDDTRFTVVIVTFLPWLLLPAYLVAGIAIGARRMGLLVVALVVMAAHITWVADDLAWRQADVDAVLADGRAGPPIEVVAANVFFGNDDVAIAFDAVLADGGDIVVLSEMRGAWWQRLQTHPIADAYPHRFRSGDVAILATSPIMVQGVVDGTDMPFVELDVAGASMTVVGVHAVPATETGRWKRDLAGLADFVAAHGDGPLVMAGDFNATAQHRQFRQLLDLGLVDAHKQQGSGWGATWPTDFALGPMLRLDHVLVTPSSLVVTSYDTRDTPGSDHDRIAADIAVLER